MRRFFGETFASLTHPHFRIVWIGALLSFLGFFMSTVVQSVVAFDLTGTNRAVGVVIFAQGSAMLALGPIGGALADRWPKRRMISTGQAFAASAFFAIAFLLFIDAITLPALAVAGVVMGVSIAFIGPARQAWIVDIVPKSARGNAMVLFQIANNASRVLGPAAAGAMLAWPASGPAGAYLMMGALYGLSGASLLLLPKSRGRKAETHVFAAVVDGLRYVAGRPKLRVLVLLFVCVIMTGFPYVTVLPGLVEHEFGRSAAAISLLAGAAAVGGLTASVVVARYADSPAAAAIFSLCGLAFGVALIALAFVPSYETAVAWMVVVGAANGGFQTLSGAVVIHETDPLYIGRVMSLTMLAFAGFGLMALPIGILADALGERVALAAMGVTVCAVVGLSWVALARVDQSAAE